MSRDAPQRRFVSAGDRSPNPGPQALRRRLMMAKNGEIVALDIFSGAVSTFRRRVREWSTGIMPELGRRSVILGGCAALLAGGRAVRYGIGVGREGFGWSGSATIQEKREWPDWYPPKEMVQRQPEIRPELTRLQGGLGMPGGPRNPLGARALYLWQNNRDTLYRIHGTTEPWTIGTSVSSGCIRMINQDAIDLYDRVPLGTKVVVLS